MLALYSASKCTYKMLEKGGMNMLEYLESFVGFIS